MPFKPVPQGRLSVAGMWQLWHVAVVHSRAAAGPVGMLRFQLLNKPACGNCC